MVRTILITGCSSGCGLDAAHTLREQGWRVFASCRKASDCKKMIDEGFESPLIDYADNASIHSGFAEVVKATGGSLDALFNNGAWTITCATEDLPTEALRNLFESNFFGWHTLTTLAVALMRKQGERGRGHIIQHSSGYGLIAGPFRAAYCASKAALEAHTQCLRTELGDTDIHLVLLNTGLIKTSIREKSQGPYRQYIAACVESSVWRSYYRAHLEPRLYGEYKMSPLEDHPPAVTAQLLRALSTEWPAVRYYVTKLIWALAFMVRALPSVACDAIVTAFVTGSLPIWGKDDLHRRFHPPEAEGEQAGKAGQAAAAKTMM